MIDEKTIVIKTYELYSKYGIKSVSVDEISVMLGISKKTLYSHIKSRDELIHLVVEYGQRLFLSEMDKAIGSEKNMIRKLALFFAYMVKNARKTNPSFLLDLKRVSHIHFREVEVFVQEKLFGTIKSIIKKGTAEGLFKTDIDIEYVCSNMILKVSDEAYRVFPAYTDANGKDVIYKLLVNDIQGITTLKGHREIERGYSDILSLL